MINGIIVSAFSQIREETESKEKDMNDKCFICSIDRVEFDKRHVSFEKHLSEEHNYVRYVAFFIVLRFINEKDMDYDQNYIVNCIKNKDITCMPIKRALSINDYQDYVEDGDDNKKA